MGFWIFMLGMVCMVPLLMLGFGKLFLKQSPGQINYLFGYRTNRSMKSQETWVFAHQYLGRLWVRCGMGLLPCSLLPLLFVLGRDEDTVGFWGGGIMIIQLILLLGTIFPTERALKKNFDKEGRPR